MKTEEPNQNNTHQKLESLSKDPQLKSGKSGDLLNRLIYAVVLSVILYAGLTFVNCNFILPGSILNKILVENIKISTQLDCKESESKAYNALFTALGYLLGLKAKIDD
jgi:hypothetical protein